MLKGLLVLICSAFVAIQASAVPFQGHNMLIAGPSPIAAKVGEEVALKGGNVIDVAVAVGLTLSVTSPYYAALGGGGFALVKMSKDVEVIDFRETAPAATSPDYYVKKKKKKDASITGGAAVGVPGFPAGLVALHKKYGKLPWKDLFEGALRVARKGMRVSGDWARITEKTKDRFSKGGKKHFLAKGKRALKPGELLKQPALAKALSRFRLLKENGFYRGPIAKDIVNTVRATGGDLTMADLANYKVRWLKPIKTKFQGYDIYLMPPPSSGGIVIKQALNLIEKMGLPKMEAFSVDELHTLGQIMNRSFRGRALLGDPDFHKNPLDMLASESYMKKMAASIKKDKATTLEPLTLAKLSGESSETTHYSVMDKNGNAIALTVTLNGNYGSAVVSDKYGVALNNEMDDFTTRPGEPNMFGLIQGEGNKVEPGKRPLSSMSPTLVVKNGKTYMTLGSPGGPRIINSVLQVLYRTLVTKMDMDQAIQAPRIHHQFLPNKLFIDRSKFAPETISGLKARGHEVSPGWMGKVYGVKMNDKGLLEAAYDARGEGGAAGY